MIEYFIYLFFSSLYLYFYYKYILKRSLFIFFTYFGFYVYIVLGSYNVFNDPHLNTLNFKFFLLIESFFFILIFILSMYLIKVPAKIEDRKPLKINFQKYLKYVLFSFILSFLIFIYYFLNNGYPLIFDVLNGDNNSIYSLRELKWTNLKEGTTVYTIGFNIIPQIVIILSVLVWNNILAFKEKILVIFFILVSIFFILINLTKSPLITIIFLSVLAFLLYTNKKMNFKFLVFLFFSIFGTITFLLKIYYLDRDFLELFQISFSLTIDRIIGSYTINSATALNIFPNVYDFHYGKSFSNPFHLLPFEPINIAQFMGSYSYNLLQNDSLPSYVIGYVNFGFIGIIYINILILISVFIFHFYFKAKANLSSINFVFYILFLERVTHFSVEGLVSSLGIEYFFVFFVYFMFTRFIL
jgi:hypothetical protein